MKKITLMLLLAMLLLLPANALHATGNNASVLQGLANLSAIEDYKLVQSFYGSTEISEYEDGIGADYRLTISSTVNGGNRTDSLNRLNLYLKLTNHKEVSDSTPFRTMTVQANAEFITQGQENIYFRLNHVNVGLTEAMPFALVDVENMKAMADLYKDTWFRTSAGELTAKRMNHSTIGIDDYLETEKQLKEDPKAGLINLSELILSHSDTDFSEEKMDDFIQMITLALETKLFSEREVVAGRNTGFTFFNLNKSAIINFAKQAAKILGEEISASDELKLRAGLSKMSLSGIYRFNAAHDVIDNFLIRFKLKNTGPLVNLTLNYRFKMSDLNKKNSIAIPSEFEEWVSPFGQPEGDWHFEDEWSEDWNEDWDEEWNQDEGEAEANL